MRILFICLSSLKFTVRTPYEEPLGGTESAMAYLSVALAKLGHSIFLMSNTKDMKLEDPVIDGVTHLPVSEDIVEINADVIILASTPQACPAIKKIAPHAKLILWNHMMPDQPAMLHLFQDKVFESIDQIVYVSDRQKQTFASVAKSATGLCLNGPNTRTFGNAIAPCFENMFSSAEEILAVKKCRGVYTSTPFRGLAILAHIKELPIEVYSSMKVYQGDDAPFATMYESLKANDCLDLRGSVSQTALRDHLRELAFFVYPSIFQECDSIALLEALAAGLKVITTDAASPQTEYIDSMGATDGSLDLYAAMLRRNINFFRSRPEAWAKKIWEQVQYVNANFTWAKKAKEWDEYLTLVCKETKAA